MLGMVPMMLSASYTPLQGAFTDSGFDAMGGSSFSIAGLSFGAEDTDRWLYVVIGITSNNQRTISSVTVGGTAASEVVFVEVEVSFKWVMLAIYKVAKPTGTSGTVAVSISGITGIQNGCGVGIYRLVATSLSETTDTDTTTGAGALSASGNVVAGDYVIAGIVSDAGASSMAWSGDLAEDYDEDENDSIHSGASAEFLTNRSISATATPTGATGSALAMAIISG